jgi:hypothetical protein
LGCFLNKTLQNIADLGELRLLEGAMWRLGGTRGRNKIAAEHQKKKKKKVLTASVFFFFQKTH